MKKKIIYGVFSLIFCLCGCADEAVIIEDNDSYSTETESVCLDIPKELTDMEQAFFLIEERRYPQAIKLLSEMEGEEAGELLAQLRYLISGDYIAYLDNGVAAIEQNGKIKAVFSDKSREDNSEYVDDFLKEIGTWENIRVIMDAGVGLDALDEKGIFYSTYKVDDSDYDYRYYIQREEAVADIAEIALMSTNWAHFSIVDKNGRLYLYHQSNDYFTSFEELTGQWENVVDIESGGDRVVVLFEDGTVDFISSHRTRVEQASPYYPLYDEIYKWTDIVDIDAMELGSVAGLKADGTVVVTTPIEPDGLDAVKYDTYKWKAVDEWKDIIAISMGRHTLLGLQRDGTVVAAGSVSEERLAQLEEWTDIVAISAGQNFHVGLKADGTIVIAGNEQESDSLPDVADMRKLFVPGIEIP